MKNSFIFAMYASVIGFVIVCFLGWIIEKYTNNGLDLESQDLGITNIQAVELLNVDRPRLLSVYKFEYKNKEYLISSRGGIIPVK